MISRRRALVETVLATFTWGFGFVATFWALKGFGPFWIAALRFILALVTAAVIVAFSKTLQKKLKDLTQLKFELRLAFLPGIFLALHLVLQAYGLKTTTATNSGFITSLYVLFVPILEWLFKGRRLSVLHLLFLALALLGTALICNFRWDAALSRGDLFTLACALAAAVQIYLIGNMSRLTTSPFLINVYQSFWAGLASLVVALWVEPFQGSAEFRPWLSILFLAVFSSLLAFMIQIRAQAVISASSASMIFLLESPIAAFFGYWFLAESLGLWQWSGAALILFATLGTVLLESQIAGRFKEKSRDLYKRFRSKKSPGL